MFFFWGGGGLRSLLTNDGICLLCCSVGLIDLLFSLLRSKCCNLIKCKDIVIMTLRGAKTIFLDTWYATIEKM